MFDLRVLYAEDEDAIRIIFERILKKFVKELFVASNGEEALELYKQHQPDIILTDIKMPKMTGFEMAEIVRKDNRLIPIIALSAHNDIEFFLEAIKLGVTNFLVKPVDAEELIRTLETVGEVVKLQKENKQKTKELEEALIKARLAEKAKGDFLAAMSHEIRTPLNAVLGFTELLKDVDNKTLRDEYLAIIESNGKNLLYIINDILDYSKIESGSFDIEPHTFEALPEFESVVELFAIKAYEKKIKLLSFIDPRIPKKLIGDSLRIRQILSNLISNAIKFTPEGKNIFINIIPQDIKDGKIGVLFEIKDEGIGIPSDKLERIFTPFSQADAGISRKFGGTGLGLSISSNLASMMGGRLCVESEEGSGSRFWIELEFDVADSTVEQVDKKSVYIVNLESCGATCMVFAKYLDAMGIDWVETAEEADVIVCYEKMEAGYEGKKKVLLTGDPFAYGTDTIRLPLSATKLKKALFGGVENKDEHSKYVDKPHGGNMPEVLVADDNKTNQKLITALFKKHGYEAVIASDGEEAVELFLLKRYPMVLLDIQMPKMNGIEAMKVIKQIDSNTQVIALTANANAGDRERFIAEGFDEYLQKPINEKELFGVLGSYYDNKTNYYVAALEESLGLDRDEIMSLLEDFVLDAAAELVPMKEAIASKNFEAIFELSHKIKGAAANLRLESVRKVACDIEENAKNRADIEYMELLHSLEREIVAINYKGF